MMRMRMKMAAVSTISLLLLCCSTISSTDSKKVCSLNAAIGTNFIVPMVAALDNLDMLIWRHNNKIILNRKKGDVFAKGNKESVSENGSLKLTNVKMSDEGSYMPQVYDKNNGKIKGNFVAQTLCVKEHVLKPTVTFKCNQEDVKFTCNVQGKDLTFAWLQGKNVSEKETAQTLTKPINQLKPHPHSCKVSNLVSSMTSEPVTHKCVVDNPIFPKELFGINTWIFVSAGGGVVLVLIVTVIVCCICTKRRKHLRLKEEGELRLAWTNDRHEHNHPPDEQQQHHHQHHPHQQPAGHTGPRQHRSRQRPRGPAETTAHPQPGPRRAAQVPKPPGRIDEEQPPPLPQPRKKAPKTQSV